MIERLYIFYICRVSNRYRDARFYFSFCELNAFEFTAHTLYTTATPSNLSR